MTGDVTRVWIARAHALCVFSVPLSRLSGLIGRFGVGRHCGLRRLKYFFCLSYFIFDGACEIV